MAGDRRNRPKGEYAVGYGKPPVHTRFKPGHSGNTRGRPRKPTTLTEAVSREMATRIRVREGGELKTMTKAQAAAKRLMVQALEGNSRALAAILKLEPALAAIASTAVGPAESADLPSSESDQEMIEWYIQALLAARTGGESEP